MGCGEQRLSQANVGESLNFSFSYVAPSPEHVVKAD